MNRKTSLFFSVLLVIALICSIPVLANDHEPVPAEMIDISATSEFTYNRASSAIDGNVATFWKSRGEAPQTITLEFVRPLTVTDFSYTPKAGEGVIGDYEVAISLDGETFEKVAEGTWDASIDSAQTIAINAEEPIVAIQLTALSSSDNAVAAAELTVQSSDTETIESYSQLIEAISEGQEALNATRLGYGGAQVASEKAALESLVDQAITLTEDSSSTIAQINEHRDVLLTAAQALESKARESHVAYLNETLKTAKSIDKPTNQLTSSINHASGVANNSAATIDQIDAAISGLINAIVEADSNQKWMSSWATALHAPAGGDAEGFAGSTIRQIVYPTADGDYVRFRFSNEFGKQPLSLERVGVALAAEGAEIVPGTHRDVTFEGKTSVTIPAGQIIWSDPVEFTVTDDTPIAISTYVEEHTGPTTWHMRAMQTSYIAPLGDFTEETIAEPFRMQKNSWYWISSVDVVTDNPNTRVIVALGDSITDGAGGTINANNRWPDHLDQLLKEVYPDANIAVLNAGISGNRVLGGSGNQGESAINRLQRDVLSRTGITDIILLEGINDIGNSENLTAEELITGYKQIISAAHEQGVRVIGATLTPFRGFDNSYFSDKKEQTRQEVNKWIRTTDLFHGVIDFDALVEDPNNLTVMRPEYHSGDFLHPGDEGYTVMGRSIDPALFDPAIQFELPGVGAEEPTNPVEPTEPEKPVEEPADKPSEPVTPEEPDQQPSEEPSKEPEQPANTDSGNKPSVPDMPKTGMGGAAQQHHYTTLLLLITFVIIASTGWHFIKKNRA